MINIIIKPNNNNKPKKINYTIENNIFLNIINQNNNNEKLRAKNDKKEKNLNEINFNSFSVKGDI